jgi:hypothetical protein
MEKCSIESRKKMYAWKCQAERQDDGSASIHAFASSPPAKVRPSVTHTVLVAQPGPQVSAGDLPLDSAVFSDCSPKSVSISTRS